MSSLLEKLKAQKLAAAQDARPKSQLLQSDAIDLRGSGLTKRGAERDTKAYEREVAATLKKGDGSDLVNRAESDMRSGVEATLAEMREANAKRAVQFDDSQLRALVGIMHNKVACLIGAAGTGKTTVTKEICNELKKLVRVVRVDETTFVTCESEKGERFRVLLKEALAQKFKILGDDANLKDEELPGIALAAFTGRASQQIKRAVPEEWWRNISTIHSLLGYAPVFEEVDYIDPITKDDSVKTVRRFRPSFNSTCMLPFTFYVFDEASMIPIPLWNELIDAMPPNARILVIGDIHQLPPPYGKGVLGYCLNKWPVYELTHIHRQAAGNMIIQNAHNILHGRAMENAVNFHMIGNDPRIGGLSPTGQSELHNYFLTVIQKLSKTKLPSGEFCYNPLKDNVIVPSNKNLCGTVALNEKLVTIFNPEVKENGIIINKRMKIHTGNNFVYFALRDKVMITKNINTTEPPITNGMLGVVESINLNGRYDQKRSQVDDDDSSFSLDEDAPLDLDLDNLNFALSDKDGEEKEKPDETGDQRQASHVMVIRFENGQTYECSTAGDYRAVTHGYATTCHKAQGGEYPNVIILCHSINAVQLCQEWLYTAVTRARNNVFIVCNKRGLDQAISRQTIKGKTLAEKIKSYLIDNKIDAEGMVVFDASKFPILPEPQEV